MPRVHKRRANKDYPEAGIVKGQYYYTWKTRNNPGSLRAGGTIHRSATPPKRSQLLRGFARELAALSEQANDLSDFDGAESYIEAVEALKDQTEESYQNLPESLQEGHILQERVEALEEWVEALEGKRKGEDDLKEEALENYKDNFEDIPEDLTVEQAEGLEDYQTEYEAVLFEYLEEVTGVEYEG